MPLGISGEPMMRDELIQVIDVDGDALGEYIVVIDGRSITFQRSDDNPNDHTIWLDAESLLQALGWTDWLPSTGLFLFEMFGLTYRRCTISFELLKMLGAREL